MTELDYLKMKLEDREKAFDKLFKKHMDLLKQQGKLEKENERLKQMLREVYDDDYYLKSFIIAIINVYNKNNGVSPIRLKMIWDSFDMDKTSLKHLKSNFHE